MSKRFIATLAGALAVVVLVAGCGGGSDSESSSADTSTPAETSAPDSNGAPALTKAEFIKQGDEICAGVSGKIAQSLDEYMTENGISETEGPTEEQEEGLVSEAVLPEYQLVAEELGALGAPEGEEEQVAEIVTGMEEVVAEGEEDPASVIGTDDPFADVNAKAVAFGFKVCGES
ncbi:MAG: hypothetical protein WBL45_02070 [Solirubrobacterales bacterium]